MTQQLSLNSEIYISVDVEAAGPIPSEYSLLSLGACVVDDTDRHFYVELKPINGNAVPAALAVSGFSLAELAEHGADPESAFQEFSDWITEVSHGRQKPVFVGFNAAFDWSFVNWYFQKYLGDNPFGFSPLDIKAYCMGLSGCRWGETTSKQLPSAFQASEAIANHNALTDAQAQAEIFFKLMNAPRSEKR